MSMMHPKLRFQPYLLRLAGLLVCAAILVLLVPTQAESVQDSQMSECTDRAIPIGFTDYDEGEPSLKVSQLDPRRQLATWTRDVSRKGERNRSINGQIILAQRDLNGKWSEELLADSGFDSWIDTSPNGAAYVSYVGGGSFVRRVTPGHPAGEPQPVRADDHPAIAVDQRNHD